MHCPRCLRWLPSNSWTTRQWEQRLCDVGGRNECRSCWEAGPTDDDYQELDARALVMQDLSHQNIDLRFQAFLVLLMQAMPSRMTRKEWSRTGLLPVRCPTDIRTKSGRDTFDPTNQVYEHVIIAEVPDLRSLMGWQFPPSAVTCGDCIECLLTLDTLSDYRELIFGGIAVKDGATFFREMSYNVWRICRVINWHNSTCTTCKTAIAGGRKAWQLADVQKVPIHSIRCTACSSAVEAAHKATMRCSRCGTSGCGLAIRLRPDNSLLCKQCIGIVS